MRLSIEAKTTTHRHVVKCWLRTQFKCSHCPANKKENANRVPRDDRHKDHRRAA